MGIIGFLKPKCGRFEKLEGFFFTVNRDLIVSVSFLCYCVFLIRAKQDGARDTHLFCKII